MPYADERIELFKRLRRAAPARTGDLFRPAPESLRTRLGTSLAELRIPYRVDEELRRLFVRAGDDLFFLLLLRHGKTLRPGEMDKAMLLEGYEAAQVRPPAWSPPASTESELERRAFYDAPELHPALDVGVLAAWIKPGRTGHALGNALASLFTRAAAEARSAQVPEPTPYLVVLMVHGALESAFRLFRDAPLAASEVAWLRGAAAAAFYLVFRIAMRESGALAGREPWVHTCAGAMGLLRFAGGARAVAGAGLLAYGVAFEHLPPRFDEVCSRAATADLSEMGRELQKNFATDRESGRKAERAAALSQLRQDLLALLRLAELGRVPTTLGDSTLAELYGGPGVLERVFQPEPRKEIARAAELAAKSTGTAAARDRLLALSRAAREWKDDEPAGWFGSEEARFRAARATATLAAEELVERWVTAALPILLERTGAEREGGLDEYDAGRLYLLTGDDAAPLLKAGTERPRVGHLFCDLKDFTRRTAFLKEAVMADFLQREFYAPILGAAAAHHRGAGHLTDQGGISLNNLLGDAISFSGDIVALMKVAVEIRRTLDAYDRRLAAESGREVVARRVAEIEDRYRARKEALQQQLDALPTLGLSLEELSGRAQGLRSDLGRMEDDRTQDLSQASGERLEAGVFVSYGATPEVAVFEDPVFGRIKVAIAEKINESARGTARNGMVRAAVEAALEAARAMGSPGRVCPLTVFVDAPLRIPVPPEISHPVKIAMDRGDVVAAERVLADAVQRYVSEAVRTGQIAQGDIYNAGVALSEEALRAYLRAREGEADFVARQTDVQALPPQIRDRFVFPSPKLYLILGVDPGTRRMIELYVYAGKCMFKGFERSGGLGIYEMIAPESQFFAAVAAHCAPEWAGAAK